MNVLESPVEALAFNYVTFGFFTLVNNLWTWIAVVTAAVSFWRIRVAGGGPFPTEVSQQLIEDRSSIKLTPPPQPEEEKPPLVSSHPEEKPEKSSITTWLVEEIAVTKGSRTKFALYYNEKVTDGGELTATEETDGGELTVTAEGLVMSEWFESWERALRTRKGESESVGWYRYQDLTEVNGNVVRLWEGGEWRARDREERNHNYDPKRCVLW